MASIVVNGDTSGAVTLQAPAVSGSTTLTLPTTSSTLATLAAQTFTGTQTMTTLTSPSATALTLQSAGTTAITVDTSQRVGIGTASPGTPLDVNGNIRAQTSGGSPTFYLLNGTTQHSIANPAGAASPLVFYNDGTERMRITSGGALLVGKTTAGAGTAGFEFEGSGGALLLTRASNPTALFNRQGSSGINIQFRFQDADCGSISVNTNSTTYTTSSDYRLKESIAPMTGALARVSLLKPVTYKWKGSKVDGQGFVAHELAEIVPECVVGEKDAVDENGNPVYQGIDTSFLVATLTAAIQELKTELDTVKAELAALKG